ncbi:hypothetical protein C7N43_10575 [Sphingobacteriales bacterium UPWRP_1]|nr:hypothetical protein BVG80_13915 [Sphingobacteriales bacterium TSM_CSM]PSJ77077.1 hypothetical protein C7N43_10575 [Sphingobacteriales bacterium UPWRP_1]
MRNFNLYFFTKPSSCGMNVTIQVLSVNHAIFSYSLLIGSIDHKEQKNFAELYAKLCVLCGKLKGF